MVKAFLLWMTAVAIVGLFGCGDEKAKPPNPEATSCAPAPRAPTGLLREDLLGTWEGFGEDSAVYLELASDGTGRMVEPPNSWAPGGHISTVAWSVQGEELALDFSNPVASQPFVPLRYDARVTASELVLVGPKDSSNEVRHPRVRCEGFGF